MNINYLRLPDGSPYIPLPTQIAFHASTADYRAFVAGVGNGKSSSCCVETVLAALLYPGSVNAVVRWDQTRLRDTTWTTLRGILQNSCPELIVRDINSPQQSILELENGSIIKGFHAKSWKAFGSLDLSSVFLDEAAECQDSQAWDQLCVRSKRHHVGPWRAWLAGLPDGHNWVWDRFVNKRLPSHQLFRGTTWDNPYLRKGYADEMQRIHGPEKARIILEGSFDAVEGTIFDQFDPTLHCVPRRPLPLAWPRYVSIDPGWSDPTASIRAAVDEMGNLIIEDFYEQSHKTVEEWSRDLRGINSNPEPRWYVIDPAADRETGHGISIMDTARKCGLTTIRAGNNDVAQSHSRVRSLLAPDLTRPFPDWHPRKGEKGSPRLFVKEHLARLIWEIMNYHAPQQGGASSLRAPKYVHKDSDGVAALRYLVMEHTAPAPSKGPPPLSQWWLDLINPPRARTPYLERISRLRR